MDPIKDAFSKVKEDMDLLKNEIFELKQIIKSLQNEIINEKLHKIADFDASTDNLKNTTDPANTTDTSTLRQEIGGLKPLNLGISTGNEGASTDRQTDTSTDTSTDKTQEIEENSVETDIYKASEILDSLDILKRDIRRKFKRLTTQEMAVFSTIYQLEEQDPNLADYKNISIKLKLSESSIRDYVQRMIDKGVPVAKNKLNNKKILLSISQELKKITTLAQIIQLRGL